MCCAGELKDSGRSSTNRSCNPAGADGQRPACTECCASAHEGHLLYLILKRYSSEMHAVPSASRGLQGIVYTAPMQWAGSPAKKKQIFFFFLKLEGELSAFCTVQKCFGSLGAPSKLGCLMPRVAFCGNSHGGVCHCDVLVGKVFVTLSAISIGCHGHPTGCVQR